MTEFIVNLECAFAKAQSCPIPIGTLELVRQVLDGTAEVEFRQDLERRAAIRL